MWAQRTPNDAEVVLTYGRVREIPAYVEWKLADDILEVGRQSPDESQSLARRILDDLILDWRLTYRHEDTELPDEDSADEEAAEDE
jgi:hypothetical protein